MGAQTSSKRRVKPTRLTSQCVCQSSQLTGSPDHLVRLEQEAWGGRQAKGLGGLQGDDELELRRLLHGEIGWFGAFEDLVHVGGGTPERVRQARAIGYEASGLHISPLLIHCREPALGGEFDNLCPLPLKQPIPQGHERANSFPSSSGEGTLELRRTSHLQGMQLHA